MIGLRKEEEERKGEKKTSGTELSFRLGLKESIIGADSRSLFEEKGMSIKSKSDSLFHSFRMN